MVHQCTKFRCYRTHHKQVIGTITYKFLLPQADKFLLPEAVCCCLQTCNVYILRQQQQQGKQAVAPVVQLTNLQFIENNKYQLQCLQCFVCCIDQCSAFKLDNLLKVMKYVSIL